MVFWSFPAGIAFKKKIQPNNPFYLLISHEKDVGMYTIHTSSLRYYVKYQRLQCEWEGEAVSFLEGQNKISLL